MIVNNKHSFTFVNLVCSDYKFFKPTKKLKIEMEFHMIASILSNEYVSAFGYFVGVVSGVIAIYQTLQVNKKDNEINQLNITINELNSQITTITTNQNTISQGERSQYFQENSGSVSIDNRG